MNITTTFILSDPYGRKRAHKQVECDFCHKFFFKPKRFVGDRNFCSRKCFTNNKHQQNTIEKICATCGSKFRRRKSAIKNATHKIHFCSRKCKDKGQRIENKITAIHPIHYGQVSTMYRRAAFENYPNCCEICGYNEQTKILEVHHIDENRKNNKLSNLIILCPNHHAMLTCGCAELKNRTLFMGNGTA